MAKAAIVVIANAKGGVGKTATAQNIAHWLGKATGKRVLAIDMDPQRGLTIASGGEVRRTAGPVCTMCLSAKQICVQ